MSNAKSTKSPKLVKVVKPVKKDKESENNVVSKPEPKKRASRAKKQLTKEETLKMLSDASNELKQVVLDLKEDEIKLAAISLKKVPELVKETLKNLEEDIEEINEQHKELLALQTE
jgi:hypothetical protein